MAGEINNKPIYDLDLVEMVILIFLMGLLFVGIIVQRRLSNRNRKTDGYIQDLERIREIFKTQETVSTLPADYSTFKRRSEKTRKRYFTSLVDISRVMNIVILVILIAGWLLFYNRDIGSVGDHRNHFSGNRNFLWQGNSRLDQRKVPPRRPRSFSKAKSTSSGWKQ